MIEAAGGLIIGLLLSKWLHVGSMGFDGLVGFIIVLALADELIASARNRERKTLPGLLKKGFFCYTALWIEQWSGAPLAPFVILVLMISIFSAISNPGTSGLAVK